jgi:rSAM/selenodomain-associated transferase 2
MPVFDHLSIVIPIGLNDTAWRDLLAELDTLGHQPEIILSACQPPPAGIKLPDHAQWLLSPQGRARQLNAGVKQTSRRWLWLLHADSRLTPNTTAELQRFIQSDGQGLGYFRLKFAADGRQPTGLNAWGANVRSRCLGLPFGDQGFVVDKAVFEQLHGFDEAVTLGEDLDFVVRLQSAGLSLQELPAELITSARRYRQHGWLRTTLRHLWLTWQLTRQAKRRLRRAP